jgi:predicted nucleotide-binding protein
VPPHDDTVTRYSYLTIRLSVETTPSGPPSMNTITLPLLQPEGVIFLVHGHDHTMRETVRRVVHAITRRRVVVLDELPNRGRDLLEKLLECASATAFAIVLMTGDDECRVRGETAFRLQPRMNVVFELALFIRHLGRDRVVALREPDVEIPSDYLGVGYIELDRHDGWVIRLAAEMRAAGIATDLNRFG